MTFVRTVTRRCRAWAATGHAAVTLTSVMNSRRRIAFSKAQERRSASGITTEIHDWRNGVSAQVADNNFEALRSVPGSRTADFRCSSLVRFSPDSGRLFSARRRQKRAKSDWYTAANGNLYSITSSAVASSEVGIVRPNVFADLRLMTNSNLVGRTTGRSAILAPLRMRSTYTAAWRFNSAKSAP